MSYLDDYLKQAQFKLSHAIENKNRDYDALLKRAETMSDKRFEIESYMIERMIKYHRKGVELTERAIALRDKAEPPPMKWSGHTNKKLKKLSILAWNIPAGHACPFKADCFGPCYALHGHYTMNPHMIQTMVSNWAASDRPDFAERLTQMVSTTRAKTIRIHDSGDFYSQAYVDAWAKVVRASPGYLFYAYTKAFYGFDLSELESSPLNNFQLIQSVGGAHDSKIDLTKSVAKIFKDLVRAENEGFVDGTQSELIAMMGAKRIGLVAHGRRKFFFRDDLHGVRVPHVPDDNA